MFERLYLLVLSLISTYPYLFLVLEGGYIYEEPSEEGLSFLGVC